eukprot:2815133-Alexandrium_andersonii.AAC.1
MPCIPKLALSGSAALAPRAEGPREGSGVIQSISRAQRCFASGNSRACRRGRTRSPSLIGRP